MGGWKGGEVGPGGSVQSTATPARTTQDREETEGLKDAEGYVSDKPSGLNSFIPLYLYILFS